MSVCSRPERNMRRRRLSECRPATAWSAPGPGRHDGFHGNGTCGSIFPPPGSGGRITTREDRSRQRRKSSCRTIFVQNRQSRSQPRSANPVAAPVPQCRWLAAGAGGRSRRCRASRGGIIALAIAGIGGYGLVQPSADAERRARRSRPARQSADRRRQRSARGRRAGHPRPARTAPLLAARPDLSPDGQHERQRGSALPVG